jgi:ElaB/YqjD/DUF883 family membrane-anchored ribosome-binding protein
MRKRMKMTTLNNFIKGNPTPELHALKDDLIALKNDGANLAQHINENASNLSRDGMDKMMEKADRGLHSVAEYIKAKPNQSMAIAFGTGLLASYLLASRR